jgi:hypothetical protein
MFKLLGPYPWGFILKRPDKTLESELFREITWGRQHHVYSIEAVEWVCKAEGASRGRSASLRSQDEENTSGAQPGGYPPLTFVAISSTGASIGRGSRVGVFPCMQPCLRVLLEALELG